WYSDAEWKRMKAAVQRTMQTGVGSELDLQALRKGMPIWVTARGEVVRNSKGQIAGLRGTIQDITDRKQSELTLAERNMQLELTSKTARVGSYVVDFTMGVINLSPGCAIVLGLPESTVEISRGDARKLVHPEDLAELIDAPLQQAILKMQDEFIAQFRIIRASDGEVRWVEARSLVFYDQDGQPLRLIS